MIFQRILIFTLVAALAGVLVACAAATEGEAATPTPVSAIEGLPLPTDSTDTIVAVIVTPTPAEGEAEEATAEPAEAAAETTPEATEAAATESEAEEATAEPIEAVPTEEGAEATAPPTGEAEAAEGTAEPAAEATEQPAEGGETAALSEEELINRGEDIYATQCAKCHQLNGRGLGETFPALRDSDIVTAEDPSAAIETVLHGREAMPAFQDTLSEQEIASVVSYIRSAWNNQASAVTTQEVEEVAASSGESESETAQSQ